MKRILLITCCVILSYIMFGRTLKIKLLNTPTISVNNTLLKEGDEFDEKAKINWSHPEQAMKVLTEDKKLYVLTPKLFSKYHTTSFSDYITSIRSTYVRNDGDNFPITADDHKHIFENTFILMDSIEINVGWKTNATSFFEATTTNLGDNNFTFILPANKNVLTLERSIFPIQDSDSKDIILSISYIETENDASTLLTDSMIVEIVPLYLTDEQ